MKKIISFALAAVAMIGFSASAQDQATKPCAKATCSKQECDKAQAGDNDRMRRPATWREFAFEGVLLSLEQQTKMDEINKEFDSKLAATCTKDSCKADKANLDNKKCDKADCKKDNCKKENCRKADCKKENCRKAKHGRHGADLFKARTEYIAQVKQVLTPEQYTTFLENIVNMPQQKLQGPNGFGREKSKMERKARGAERRVARDAQNLESKAARATKKAERKVEKAANDVKNEVKKEVK